MPETIPGIPDEEKKSPSSVPVFIPPDNAGDRKRPRTTARAAAVQIFFQSDQNGEDPQEVLGQFLLHRTREDENASFEDGLIPDADLQLLGDLIKRAAAHKKEVDATLRKLLPERWRLERIDPVLRAILRLGISELTTDTPAQILINEYLDVSQGFLDPEMSKMVNGLLDHFAKSGRSLA